MPTCREIQFLLKEIQLQNDSIMIPDYTFSQSSVCVSIYKPLLLHVLPNGSVSHKYHCSGGSRCVNVRGGVAAAGHIASSGMTSRMHINSELSMIRFDGALPDSFCSIAGNVVFPLVL